MNELDNYIQQILKMMATVLGPEGLDYAQEHYALTLNKKPNGKLAPVLSANNMGLNVTMDLALMPLIKVYRSWDKPYYTQLEFDNSLNLLQKPIHEMGTIIKQHVERKYTQPFPGLMGRFYNHTVTNQVLASQQTFKIMRF